MLIIPPRERVLDAAALGEAEVAALDHDFHAQLFSGDPARVVAVVADVSIGLIAPANVSADAAVVKHLDRGAQDRAQQAVAVERVRIDTECGANFGTQLDALEAAPENPAALADQRRVVIGPARSRGSSKRRLRSSKLTDGSGSGSTMMWR